MKVQKITYRWGLKQPDDPEEVTDGLVELRLRNGRTLEVPVQEVDTILIHSRLED